MNTPETTISDQTVLVTGGGGFVGSHLADALVGENTVRVLDDFSNGSRENVPAAATVVEGDIRNPETLQAATDGVDLIFHEAAMVSVPESIAKPSACTRVNHAAVVDLLECARREDARFVFASSTAVYGDPEYLPLDEEHPTEPVSPYGIDKLAADQYVRAACDLYGVETVALRYFNIYGPRQTGGEYAGVIAAFLEQAAAGESLTVHGSGSQTRDFVHVRDVVRANLAAATTDAVGEAFNVGTGESVSVAGLANDVQALTGDRVDVVHTDARDGDIEHNVADTTKASEELGFEAEVAFDEGLRDLIESRVEPRA
ncbi:NAD-dependent epimerase/dehydratase family protein [Halobacterium zhouii]|uniref:NAD-dependent epimerase/dehydratase family protein n=1 Tax=Halobacterium zhouii TaxID=2902624 RepID=UPI001E54D8B5|nr:NAD-dependent epimerase/dehydratase family protein [Halobacterium zhouii]